MKVSAERLEALIAEEFADAGRCKKTRAAEAFAAFVDSSERAKDARLADAIQQRIAPLVQVAGAAMTFAAQNAEVSNEGERNAAVSTLRETAHAAERAQSFGVSVANPEVLRAKADQMDAALQAEVRNPRGMASTFAGLVASGSLTPKPLRAGEAEIETLLSNLHAALLRELNRPSRG